MIAPHYQPITHESLIEAGWVHTVAGYELPFSVVSRGEPAMLVLCEDDPWPVLFLIQGPPDGENATTIHLNCGEFRTMEDLARLIRGLRGSAPVQ